MKLLKKSWKRRWHHLTLLFYPSLRSNLRKIKSSIPQVKINTKNALIVSCIFAVPIAVMILLSLASLVDLGYKSEKAMVADLLGIDESELVRERYVGPSKTFEVVYRTGEFTVKRTVDLNCPNGGRMDVIFLCR